MKININIRKKNKLSTPLLIINGDMKSILISNVSTEKVFFQYVDSKLEIIILDSNNQIRFRKFYYVVEKESLTIKSIILYDKNDVKSEIFLTLTDSNEAENSDNSPSIRLLLTKNDLKTYSAHNLITNTKPDPSKVVFLEENESFSGNKYHSNGVVGGKGPNIIIGGDKNDNLAGGDDNDIIVGLGSSDSLFGQNGDDILVGGGGNDWLAGGNGNDILDGGDGDDELQGDAEDFSNDTKSDENAGKRRGNDIIFAGNGNDLIFGGKNNNYLAGGRGNDRYGFFAHDGINMIVEYGGEENTIIIEDYYFHELKYERYGNHLVISSIEKHHNNLVIVIKDQYAKDGYKIKHLQTKSYIDDDNDHKNNHAKLITEIVRQHVDNPDKLLSQLTTRNDFSDYYRTDLSEVFAHRMPDTEILTGKKLIDVLKDKNKALQQMYQNNSLYFGDNVPDITYITEALSSFAPKEASQTDLKYLKHYNSIIYNSSRPLAAITDYS